MTQQEIHTEIERASERRSELYRLLSRADPATAAELKQLDTRLEQLWNEHRASAPAFASATQPRSSSGPASKSGWSARPNHDLIRPGRGYTLTRSGR